MTQIRSYAAVVVVALLVVAPVAPHAVDTASAAENAFVVEQGDRCFEVSPLEGGEDVVDFYDYRSPIDDEEYTYSTYMPSTLPREDTSRLFLYDGPEGVSLVIVHNERGASGGGSAATFRFSGLPGDGEWALVDDNYDDRDDRISRDRIDWTWYGDRTDGGIFRGIDAADTRITIDPAFDERAALYDDLDRTGEVRAWQFLSGSVDDPATTDLRMSRPITIRAGSCTDSSAPDAALAAGDGVAGVPVSLDASGASDDRGVAEYRWDVDGDGEVERTTSTPSIDHVYDDPGEYRARVTVADAAGNTDAAAANVTVEADAPPEAAVTVATDAPTEGFRTVLDATATVDDVGVASYRWDLDGDGEIERTTDGPRTGYVYNESGTYEASVTAVDRGGSEDTATVSVSVGADESPAPTIEVAAPADPVRGEQFVFEAGNTTDDTGIDTYRWAFGDNATATGETVTHRFDAAGSYEVALEATDEGGNAATATVDVEVLAPDETPPTAAASADPPTVEAGASVTLDAADATDDRRIASYRWAFGDGSTGSGETASHIYDEPGTYTATVTVTDAAGNAATANATVEVVRARPPNVSATVPDAVGVDATLDVEGSAADRSRIAGYRWAFGDGATARGPTANHSYDDPGNYTVTLTATDRAGNANRTAARVRVLGPDRTTPTAALSVEDEQASVGDDVTFDATNSSDDRGVAEYRWTFGDGETRTTDAARVDHAYGEPGSYNATVTVVDVAGNDDTAAAVGVRVTEEQAIGDSGGGGSAGGGGSGGGDDSGGSGGGGGGGGSAGGGGSVSVLTETEARGPNATAVDVRNARGDETVTADLPATDAADQTGLRFRAVEIDLATDDPHFVVETARGADGGAELPADEAFGSLAVGAKYLDAASVERVVYVATVARDRLDAAGVGPDDLAAYQRRDGEWSALDATVTDRGERVRVRATADAIGALAVGADRPYAVTEATLAAESVAASDSIAVNATVRNERADSRTFAVDLTADGEPVATETVAVPGGETAAVAFERSLAPGTHEVAVAGEPVGTVSVADPVADIAVADLSANASRIDAGDRVAITASVENRGAKDGQRELALGLFGEAVATETVAVPAGERRSVTFVREIGAAGDYTASAGGETVEIAVVETGPDATDSSAPDASIPGLGASGALIALVGALLVAARRGRAGDR
ncbi:PKD domain-containing protein [Halorussus marinus]|uniref:PKD domain-containing protein n=1 Tax=Halorussus marinus TaxID=2505976 RepID=UPI00106EC85A|nr:PKD domain-containing protein [Halorussus marinus]